MSHGSDEGPSLREGLEGTAHLYDLLRQYTKGEDPEMREKVNHLDRVSVADVLSAGEMYVRNPEQAEPSYPYWETRELRDGDGKLFVIDTSGTPVEPNRLEWQHMGVTEHPDTGDATAAIRVRDPELSYERYLYLPPNKDLNVSMTSRDQTASIAVAYDRDEPITPEPEPEPATDEDDDEDDDEGEDTAGATEYPTVEEAIEDNEWIEELIPDAQRELVLEQMGDVRIDELLEMMDQSGGGTLGMGGGSAEDISTDTDVGAAFDDIDTDEDEPE